MTPAVETGGASVRLEGVEFAYGGEAPMRFDLDIGAGDSVAVMGASGSGKSTLLHLIAGFETPRRGRILIDDADVAGLAPAERPVSMVFQENNVFAHLDVESNVGLGRSPALRLSPDDRADVADAIARTGLAGKERRLPSALSGGERQRVALARVLVRARPILLLDEPFASLGPALADDMLDLVAALGAERDMTILMATHDPHEAERLAGTVVFIENGEATGLGPTKEMLAGGGPAAFARYLGIRRRPH